MRMATKAAVTLGFAIMLTFSAGSAVAAVYEVNNLSCLWIRTGLLIAVAPVPDGRQDNVAPDCILPVPAVEVASVLFTDEIGAAKAHGMSVDHEDINGESRTVWGRICDGLVGGCPQDASGEHGTKQELISFFHKDPRWLPVSLGQWEQCIPLPGIPCVDFEAVGICGRLIGVAGEDNCFGDNIVIEYTWWGVNAASVVPAGSITDPGNDNQYVKGNLTYWKIKDPDVDGSLSISQPIEGLSVVYQDGHWIVQSLSGKPIMVDHEPALERWTIRVAG